MGQRQMYSNRTSTIFCEVITIKLLTLNTHSLVEENYRKKLHAFVDTVIREMPEIIALQEVNQTCTEDVIAESELPGFYPCNKYGVIRKDNHAYCAVNLLAEAGIKYYWTWLGIKKGYDKYDEGIAILSRSKIIDTDVSLISDIDDYNNWKTRKIVGICTQDKSDTWFYSVHMGWWDDKEEPFEEQWRRLDSHVKKHATAWLMGDFNSPAEVKHEGYEMIEQTGWFDSYKLAREKDSGITVGKVIDGWKEKLSATDGMRIDHIWCNKNVAVKNSRIIFNGKREPVVSDHYGLVVVL